MAADEVTSGRAVRVRYEGTAGARGSLAASPVGEAADASLQNGSRVRDGYIRLGARGRARA